MPPKKKSKPGAKKRGPLERRPRKVDPRCIRCNLHRRSMTVCCPGEGQENAEIMLVGEALGADEDKLSRPFVGDSGRKLMYLLQRCGIKRRDLYITNSVRCHPPKNDTPKKKHLEACGPYLLFEILKVRPKVIVAMGRIATELVTKQQNTSYNGLRSRRGFPKWVEFKWSSPKSGKLFRHACWVIPTYHPSAALRGGGWVLDDLIEYDLKLAQRYAIGKDLLVMPDTKVNVIQQGDIHGALDLIARLKAVGSFVVDIEATGRLPIDDELLCLGFCAKAGEAWVLPILQQNCEPYWLPVQLGKIQHALEDLFQSATLYGQNIKFDIQWLRKLTDVTHFNIGGDAMVSHHCLDENKPHNLTFLCQQYLGWDRYDEAMLQYYVKAGKKFVPRYELAPNDILWRYNGYDVDGTFQVLEILDPQVGANKLRTVVVTELALSNPLADTEYRGVRVDVKKLKGLADKQHTKAADALVALRKMYAEDYAEDEALTFNPASHKQLAAWFVKIDAGITKKTKAGAVSTEKNVLAKLALEDSRAGQIAQLVRDLRSANKLLGTYLDGTSLEGGEKGISFKDEGGGFLKHVCSDGYFHPSYNASLTVTGRLSANDPAIQTMPRKGDLRSILIPDSDDDVFLSCDYSKVELCVMAWLSNDEVMARELISGVDLHSRMALAVRLNRDPTDEEFEVMLPAFMEEPGWHNERAMAKSTVFGASYGRTAQGIVEANPESFPEDMSDDDRISVAQAMLDAFWEKYKGVRAHMDRQIATAHKVGRIRTKFTGRTRRFAGVNWYFSPQGWKCKFRTMDLEEMNREAMNFQVQSIASDELSRATARVYAGLREMEQFGLVPYEIHKLLVEDPKRVDLPRYERIKISNLRIVMTLHDQLLFNVHKDAVDEASYYIQMWMNTVLPADSKHKFEMPLKVDVSVQKAWGVSLEGESEY